MKTKEITILHSNDMHGDFLAEMRAGETRMRGGLALLSGYTMPCAEEQQERPFM
jgi:5'-nucleotidase